MSATTGIGVAEQRNPGANPEARRSTRELGPYPSLPTRSAPPHRRHEEAVRCSVVPLRRDPQGCLNEHTPARSRSGRRRRRLLAPDGRRRGGHARTAQGAFDADLIDPKIAEHRGRIVKTTGDGVLVEFASAVDAVRCAVEIQREMAERNADVSAERAHRVPHRHQRRRHHHRGRRHLRRRRQHRGAARRRSPSPAASASRARVHDQVRDKLDDQLRGHRRAASSRTSRARCTSFACERRSRRWHRCADGRSGAAGQAVDRRAAVRQHERRSRAGVLRRRHHRGHHHRPLAICGGCS